MTRGTINHIRPRLHKSGAPMYAGNSTEVKPIKTLISPIETIFKILKISTGFNISRMEKRWVFHLKNQTQGKYTAV